ncbi:MAG: T9SS type A sorting domain-containing protein [Bacteroidetes bacterium]|nr:T9SS type A sorting domain-containing protein [Bacteroidota bacterium]
MKMLTKPSVIPACCWRESIYGKIKNFLLLILFAITSIFAQNLIPFASHNNIIELSIANTSAINTSGVIVTATKFPTWLHIANAKYKIETIKTGETSAAKFTFSVDKSAPINKAEHITFTIANSNGEQWIKTISLQVAAPERFELFQNYPNPFNPTTTIAFQIPAVKEQKLLVSLKVFDVVGREVATLVNEPKEAGSYDVKFDASKFSSGIYFYALQSGNFVQTKKMALMK